MSRAPECVFTTSDPVLADVVVARLASEGVEARVFDNRSEGNLLGASRESSLENNAVEVWVTSLEQRDLALQILAAEIADNPVHTAQEPAITVICEECGAEQLFTASSAGHVEECESCGAFIDVPGEGPDMGDIDSMDDTAR